MRVPLKQIILGELQCCGLDVLRGASSTTIIFLIQRMLKKEFLLSRNFLVKVVSRSINLRYETFQNANFLH